MDQNAREKTMRAFRDRRITLLVCTDIASRGLDVKDVTHVINYSIPREGESYVHRIERMTQSKMKEGKIPSRKEVAAKKLARILPGFQGQDEVAYRRATELMDSAWNEAIQGMSCEEIAGRFLSWMHPQLFLSSQVSESVPSFQSPHGSSQLRQSKGRLAKSSQRSSSF